jgi:hypothetical protein
MFEFEEECGGLPSIYWLYRQETLDNLRRWAKDRGL